jgi:uncharacterized membrane protein
LNKAAAEQANKSDWFDCKMVAVALEDSYDTSCLVVSMQGDGATCGATVDQDGQACEWCSLASYNLCVTSDQAEIVEQLGADCGSGAVNVAVADPYDMSCLTASIPPQGDEITCESAIDQDGQSCEWCSLASVSFCANADQAQTFGQLGADCGSGGGDVAVEDPYDASCLVASMQGGDEATCEATVDQDGQACEWCSLASYNLCVTSDQAETVEQLGADCGSGAVQMAAADPYDTSCLVVSMQGDGATCGATVDQDGQACEWCSLASYNLCVTSDQAEIVEQLGADCGSGAVAMISSTA